MTVMTIGIFVVMSTWVQNCSSRYSETVEILNNFADLAENDIQAILSEDGTKYGTAYTYLQDLYILNDQYQSMKQYNQTHPGNYTQQDFDDVAIEFTSKMRSLIFVVQSTWVYKYGVQQLNVDVANNYTYRGEEYFFIINKWYKTFSPYEEIDSDLKKYVNTSFFQSGDILELPEIKFDKWTYYLYNNLSILEFIGTNNAINFLNSHLGDINLILVNLSLSVTSDYINGYVYLSERTAGIIQDYNNTLITLALAGVLLGFSASFDNKKYRKITMILGLITLFLSIIYFISASGTLSSFADFEATQILKSIEFQFY